MKQLFSLIAIISLVALTSSCGKSVASDEELNSKIVGTWEIEMEETETEDGIKVTTVCKETITYYADNTFYSELTSSITKPSFIAGRIFSASLYGTWSIESSKLIETIDERSINVTYVDTDLASEYDIAQSLIEDGTTTISSIEKLSGSELVINDGEETMRYKRK